LWQLKHLYFDASARGLWPLRATSTGSIGYLLAVYNQLWPYDDERIAVYLQCTIQRLPDLYAAKLPPALARTGDSLKVPLDVLPTLLRECRELGRVAGCDGNKLALLLHRARLVNRGKKLTGESTETKPPAPPVACFICGKQLSAGAGVYREVYRVGVPEAAKQRAHEACLDRAAAQARREGLSLAAFLDDQFE
jgi:hypothetical protein